MIIWLVPSRRPGLEPPAELAAGGDQAVEAVGVDLEQGDGGDRVDVGTGQGASTRPKRSESKAYAAVSARSARNAASAFTERRSLQDAIAARSTSRRGCG